MAIGLNMPSSAPEQIKNKRVMPARDYGLGCCALCNEPFQKKASRALYCQTCRAEYKKQWQRKNAPVKRAQVSEEDRQRNREQQRNRYRENRAASISRAAYYTKKRRDADIEREREKQALRMKKWRAANSSSYNRQRAENERKRRETDSKFAIDRRMITAIRNALRQNKGGRSWESIVGYSVADLMRHLERQFLKGMTWENRSEWHIDHILPLSSFTYQSDTDEAFRAAWAISNLRPLWKKENLKKSGSRVHLL